MFKQTLSEEIGKTNSGATEKMPTSLLTVVLKKTFGIIILVAVALCSGAAIFHYMQKHAANTGVTSVVVATSTPYAYQAGNLLLGTDSDSAVGTYVIGSSGRPLYVYAKDSAGVSTCAGSCAVMWAPYTVPNTDVLRNTQYGITGAVGTITRDDGSMQVTYNEKPLYYYVGDTVSEDLMGNGIDDVWSVAKP